MASSDDGTSLDVTYILAALVEEAGGALTVSTEWFTSEKSVFEGKALEMGEIDGTIYITLTDIKEK